MIADATASDRADMYLICFGLSIVIAGSGEYSKKFINLVKNLKIPVVVSSRIDDGISVPLACHGEGALALGEIKKKQII